MNNKIQKITTILVVLSLLLNAAPIQTAAADALESPSSWTSGRYTAPNLAPRTYDQNLVASSIKPNESQANKDSAKATFLDSVQSNTSSANLQEPVNFKLVLDPDNNVGYADWPNMGRVTELPYNLALAKGIQEKLQADGCTVDVLLTRESTTPGNLSRDARVQTALNFDADMFVTLAFNALNGSPWGYKGDGGVEAWARSGHPDDDALANEFFNQITSFTGRPHRKPILHPSKYAEFNNDLPSDIIYAHIEALFLDHNYDWPIINTNFNLIIDGSYTAIRKQLEARGVTCIGENGEISPYPTPPSADLLQRLRDLGFQNYQKYGADPVSFSTGNHVISQEIFSLPGQGGSNFDFTLIYNSQDARARFFGTGWSAPISYVQRYSDDSFSLTFADGRTYYFPVNGQEYEVPEDFNGTFTRTDTGWELIELNGTKSTFQETETGLGLVTGVEERHGNKVTYDYDLTNQSIPLLKSITDTAGREFIFESNEDGYITKISLPDGRQFGFEYTDGNLTKIIDAKGGAYQYEYDERNRIKKEWDPAGFLFLQVEYDDQDRVSKQVDASGAELHISYEEGATKYIDNLGNITEYHFDEQHRVTKVVDALGFSVSYEYDDQDNLKRFTDERGNVFEYEYDSDFNLLSEKGPNGHFATYTYNAFGDLTSVTDKGGPNDALRTTKMQVSDLGDVERITYADGTFTQFTYDSFGNIQSVTDQNGADTTFTYNALGLLESQSNQLGNKTQFEYDNSGRLAKMTDANGHIVKFEYDQNDNIVKIIDPKGIASTFVYDSNDNLVEMTDRRGGKWIFTYDDDLKLATETDPEGHTTRYGYDLMYNLTSVTDPNGNATRYTYNERYEVTQEIAANGGVTQFLYDPSGNLTQITDALGQKTIFEFNGLGLLVAQTDARGGRSEFVYDDTGRLVQETNPRGAQTLYKYDLLDRPIEIQDALDGISKFEYDVFGNPIAITDANGNTTRMEYDLTGQLVSTWNAVGSLTTFEYDSVGNLKKITDARNAATLFDYDENDSVTQITDALGGLTKFMYDNEENLVATTDARGNTARFEYDLDGLMGKTIEAGDQTSLFTYDPAHNLSGFTNAKNNTWSFTFDEMNQQTQETDPLGYTTNFGYDLLGRLTSVTDAKDVVTQYGYDPLSNLIGVTQNATNDTPNNDTNVVTKYGYDEVSNLTSIADANGHATTFTYDLLDRVIGERNALGDQWAYEYDPAGNLTSRLDANGNHTTYTYTANNLLEHITYPNHSFIHYTYNETGNQLSAEASWLGTITNTYDLLGRLSSSTDHTGKTVQYGYDAVSNQTKITYPDGKFVEYGYDSTNYLNQVIDPEGNNFHIIRDATHNTARVDNPNSTFAVYRYDPAERLVSITNLHADNTLVDRTIYLLDEVGNRVQKDSTSMIGQGKPIRTVSQYRYDPLYRLVYSSDSAGTYSTYTYDPVGNRTNLTTNTNPVIGRQRETLNYKYTYNEINALTDIGLQSTWRNVSGITTHMEAFINDVRAQSGKGINTDTAAELTKSATTILDLVNGGITDQQKLETALTGLDQQIQTALDQGKIKNVGVANGLQAKITDGKAVNKNSKPNSIQSYIFNYDQNGNRIERIMPDMQGNDGWIRTAYEYDFENRLTGTQDFRVNNPNSNNNGNPGAESQMAYDAYGRLFERSYDQHSGGGGIQSTQFAYDGLDPIVEYTGPSDQYTNYYRGDGRILSMLTNAGANYAAGRAEYFHYDGLNSVTTLTKQDGQSAHAYGYSDFGTILDNNGHAQDASSFTDPHNHYTYTGQEWDENNGLYHFYAREYDPFTGTWLQQDPYRGSVLSPISLNRYSYVGSSPITYFDVNGFDRNSNTIIGSLNEMAFKLGISPSTLINSLKSIAEIIKSRSIVNFASDFSSYTNKGWGGVLKAALALKSISGLDKYIVTGMQSAGNFYKGIQLADSLRFNKIGYPWRYLALDATGHHGMPLHINSDTFKVIDHTELVIKSQTASKYLEPILKYGGKAAKALEKIAVPLAVTLDAIDIGSSAYKDYQVNGKLAFGNETKKAVGRVAGGWGGAWAGAQTGAAIGTFIGGPVGTVVGGVVGAVGGALGGAQLGETIGGWFGSK